MVQTILTSNRLYHSTLVHPIHVYTRILQTYIRGTLQTEDVKVTKSFWNIKATNSISSVETNRSSSISPLYVSVEE